PGPRRTTAATPRDETRYPQPPHCTGLMCSAEAAAILSRAIRGRGQPNGPHSVCTPRASISTPNSQDIAKTSATTSTGIAIETCRNSTTTPITAATQDAVRISDECACPIQTTCSPGANASVLSRAGCGASACCQFAGSNIQL